MILTESFKLLQLMTISSMCCTSKVVSYAAVRMRADRDQASKDPSAGYTSPAADKNPETPNVAGARGYPRAVFSFAFSSAGGSPIDANPVIKVVC